MKILELPQNVSEVVQNNNGYKMYLNNLERGRPATPRSWLYENKSWEEVLALWLTKLKSKLKDENEQLVLQYELSFLEKFGPQGKVAPVKELMGLVTEGYGQADSPFPAIFRTKLWQQAKANTVKRLFRDTGLYKTLRPRGYRAVLNDMRDRETLESNSGYPLFTRRKKPEVIEHSLKAIETGEYKEFPATLLFRNYNGKTRPVWMYPLATNLVEGSFAQPLKQALLDNGDAFFTPWRGWEYVQKHITDMYASNHYLSASDFSHTDAYFTKHKTLEVYDVIKFAFQPQYWEELKDSLLRVNTISLIAGENTFITGEHGVSSGSVWTNDIETYMDLIAEEYLALLGLVTEPDTAIGDDISHKNKSYNEKFAEQIAAVYKQMNFDVNAEKVTNERDWLKYLQRLVKRGWFSQYEVELDGESYKVLRGVYRTIKALNSSLLPEKFHSPKLWSVNNFCVRQFMILENCIDHPLFIDFCKFIARGSAHLGKFAKLAPKEINAAQQASRTVPGLNPTYNQNKKRKPMSKYVSIQVIRDIT
nr:MAG: putative RNA-dependent RNA polymerase [Picobirnavirus sp.]